METPFNFDDIRTLYDSEVPETIDQLINDPHFQRAAEPLVQPLTWEKFAAAMENCETKEQFQRNIIYPTVTKIIKETTSELKGFEWDNIENGTSYVYISNHRDIVLDAGFLNMLFFDKHIPTTEIAIGDNLLIYPWIEKLVKLNKSFIVKRGVSVRQMLEESKKLSLYIHDTVENRNQSVWISQREGRAKDSNDKTQTGLLKMLTLADSSNPMEALKRLRILPIAISYEFDPCDYLKAKEFQLKRDNADYKKSQADDIENMITGIMGYKGRVHFKFGECINEKLDQLAPNLGRNELLDAVAEIIDKEIYRNYEFFPFNYVAYDLMTESNTFPEQYTQENQDEFDSYLQKQIEKINLLNKDEDFLRHKLIEMYGNTVKNQLLTTEE